jgi:hypothetical protein
VTVFDGTAPTLDGVPEDDTVECDAIPCAADVTAYDNCDGISLHYTEVRNDGDCPYRYTLTRTWTATDACGHPYSESQILTVVDTHSPVFNGIEPTPINDFECVYETRPVEQDFSSSFTENCGTYTVDFDYTTAVGSCDGNYYLHYVWFVEDQCGNNDTVEVTHQVIDTTAPVCDVVPAESYECVDNLAVQPYDIVPTPYCDDACENTHILGALTTNEVVNIECAGTYQIHRVWELTDDCGNRGITEHYVTVTDSTNPEFNEICPSSVTVECDSVPEAAVLTARDDCDADVPVTYIEERTEWTPACNNHYTLTRTWTAVDDCNHQISCVQVITVEDTTAPVITGVPEDYSGSCEDIPCPEKACATDNCDGLDFSFTETIANVECPNEYDLVRTWVATDDC